MVGLVLEGGGVRGSYQIGAYIAMYDLGIKIDGFCGTSIGSFNAAMLASGKHFELLDFWENIDVAKIFNIKPLTLKNADFKSIKSSIKSYLNVLTNKGMDVDGLLHILEENIDVDALYNSNKDYGLVTVKLKDLTPVVKFKESIPKAKIREYILASCYLPIFEKKKIIDDSYYFDGGIYDISPANMLIKKGYKKIYVIELKFPGVKQKINDDVEIITISPSRNLGGFLTFNQETIKDNIKMGYYDTIRKIKNFDGYKFVFKRKSFFYKFITRKVDDNLLKRVSNFFGSTTLKETVLKSIEHIMEKENYDYYQIYNPIKEIRKIQRIKNNNFIHEFVRQLKIF